MNVVSAAVVTDFLSSVQKRKEKKALCRKDLKGGLHLICSSS